MYGSDSEEGEEANLNSLNLSSDDSDVDDAISNAPSSNTPVELATSSSGMIIDAAAQLQHSQRYPENALPL